LFFKKREVGQKDYSPIKKKIHKFAFDKVKVAKADFPTAEVQFDIYAKGAHTLSVLRYIYRPLEEIDKEPLVPEIIERLRRLER